MQLKDVREKIDKIDQQMLVLLNQRAQQVFKVNKIKKDNDLEIFVPAREAHILRRLKHLNKGPLTSEDIEVIFREVLSVNRSLDTALKICYLGPQGTFTHLAAIKKFGNKSKYIPVESINEVFEKVEKGESRFGVVPVENSTEGAVNYTLDMFFSSPLKICSEVTLNISHSLLGSNLGNIKRIYSKSEVFGQCRKWISGHLPSVELISMPSTAKAALTAKKDKQSACIGNKILAGLYGLKVIASSIEDYSLNMTRFIVISKNDSSSCGHDKTSILFSIKDKVGALYDVLNTFRKYKINLTKIESRPSKKKLWDYYFFVDLEGHRDLPLVSKALGELERKCAFLKVLGSYPKEI